MADKLWIDTETYNETPISYGTYRYAESSEIMVISYAVNDDDPTVLDLTSRPVIHERLMDLIEDHSLEVWAHNSMFDRNVLRFNGVKIPLSRWRDTMIQAFSHSLPGSLDKLGEVLGLPQDKLKLKAGKDHIQLFCKPRPSNHKLRRATGETHPQQWDDFLEYAGQDIVTMRECHKRMPQFSYPRRQELMDWHLDQLINDRGFCVDLELAEAAQQAVRRNRHNKSHELGKATDGAVYSATQRDLLLEYILEAHGVALPDMRKDTLERRLGDPDMPEGVKELLRIRLQSASSSTSKYTSVRNGTNSDGRCRGTIQFCGAKRTGRAAGRTFQPQNLPSRGLLNEHAVMFGIDAMKAEAEGEFFDDVNKLAVSCVRGLVTATPGKKLFVSDLSNIEGRKVAWFANEEWKLKAFADFDAGKGHDIYNLTYANSFKVDVESVKKPQRQIGKVLELFLGYQGGVGAFLTGAATYGFDVEKLANDIWDTLPKETVKEAEGFYEWALSKKIPTFGLSKKAYVTCDTLKRLWRASNPNVVQLWKALEDGALKAIAKPGTVIKVGKRLRMVRNGAWFRVILPSGRSLCYPGIKVEEGKNGKMAISYLGENQYTRKWQRINTYGGKLLENCIAKGTLVLTESGVKPIEDIRNERVWDGVEWVPHSGLVYRGKQIVYDTFGVNMTEDHKVLTTEGWINASQSEGYNRATCRLPDGYALPRKRWKEVSMGGVMRLWENYNNACVRIKEAIGERCKEFLWVYEGEINRGEQYETWYVGAPRVRGVPFYDRPLPTTNTPSVGQLRRTGDKGLRALGRIVCKLLERYGGYLPAGLLPRKVRQQFRIFSPKLHVGYAQETSEQHEGQQKVRHAERDYDDSRSFGVLRNKTIHDKRTLEERMAGEKGVYDLLSCGPRNRFTVIGKDGKPLIVHNCCQASARDVLYRAMQPAEDAGFKIVLHVHDELVTEGVDDGSLSVELLDSILAEPRRGFEGLPLAAGGFEGYVYRK